MLREKQNNYLIILLISTILLLSGCTIFENQKSFIPNESFFFNPENGHKNSFYINSTEFHNKSKHKIIIGLQDKQEFLGINISLNLNVRLIGLENDFNLILVNASSNLFVTNSSGIAEYIFTYNQEMFKNNRLLASYGYGHIQIYSPEINNLVVESKVCTFTYRKIQITRETNATNGITAISHCENLNCSKINISSLSEQYASTIEGNFGNIFVYTSYAYFLDIENLTEDSIEALWMSGIKIPLYLDKWDYESSNISSINIPQGWLIVQYFTGEKIFAPLDQEGIIIYQIVILDHDYEFIWFRYNIQSWMA